MKTWDERPIPNVRQRVLTVTDRVQKPDDDRRIIPFRPRPGARDTLPWRSKDAADGGAPAEKNTLAEEDTLVDLTKFEAGEERDDFRQRMTVNLLAFGFTAILIAAGVWIVISLAEAQKNQDCVLSGRRSCETIAAPPMERY